MGNYSRSGEGNHSRSGDGDGSGDNNRKGCVFGSEGTQTAKGKGKLEDTEYISISSDSSSDSDRLFEPIYEIENEVSWTKVVKNPTTITSQVLQIPAHVIRACMTHNQKTIVLCDMDTGITYDCAVKKRAGKAEMYVTGGWYEYVRQQNLKTGDIMQFCIRYPPADELLVAIVRAEFR